ncbi:hypothetical protein I3271_05280 [Photobacterium leiognathi]|uniref:hypothetical protein n=1 Tax=Photobacterium leiognathi TaxID=553611 RepID=UPI001EDF705C|nr:hypothetical protein [Photobacterium leiognathi]MCG3884092.1 hypothetical protein [Photobacterium leiognathi]
MSIKQVKQQLEAIWKLDPYWKRFLGSQFANGLAEFVGQMVYRCNQYASRRLQESFLSKATMESSILAAAEDRAYVGRKISPSKGIVTIKNPSKERVTLPKFSQVLDASGNYILIEQPIDLYAGMSIDVEVSQVEIVNVNVLAESKKWFSTKLDKELTANAHNVDVFVDGELWTKAFKFRNTNSDSKAYMEFYTSQKQLGFRFGNGISGRIPNDKSHIWLRVWKTQGEYTLLDGQKLTLANGDYPLEIKTKTIISGGAAGASIEDVRNGALYLTAYDHQLAWNADYKTFIGLNVGGLIYLDVWGEAEQEALHGKDIRNINKIFFTAYSDIKTDDRIKKEVSELFVGREGYNEEYVWVDRVDSPFTLNVTAKALPNAKPDQAELFIKQLLVENYGKDNTDKSQKILVDEIWNVIHEQKANAGISEFKLVANDLFDVNKVGHYQFIDIENSNINVTY